MPPARTRTCSLDRRPALLSAAFAALAFAFSVSSPNVEGQSCPRPCVGPERGAIVAAGGGSLGLPIYQRFVELAGGADAHIVLIPTAGTQYGSHDGWTAIERLREAGVRHLEVLHTRSRSVADLEAFASPLEDATGVWFSGGHQWRLVDVYLGTETHRELTEVLARGGVIGGNSAGASALASFLVRGGGRDGDIIATERVDGFGFLRNVALDQHLLERGRENEMFQVLRREPHLLGIGLNEGAAIVVAGNLARVVGGRVAIYDLTDPLTLIPLLWLDAGDVYDLGARRVVLEDEDTEPALTGRPDPESGSGSSPSDPSP